MADSGPLSGIAETSLGVAALRALESGRADRLFDDPYARLFVAAAGAGEDRWSAGFLDLMSGQVAVRTRFFDEALLAATRARCRQVVLLASGMDARAYRLDWPAGTRVFEVDFAEVLRFKQDVLAGHGVPPRCDAVAADLRADWPEALRGAGFRPEVPTAWLAEGILYGLPAEGADRLLDMVTASSAPGSEFAADHSEDSDLLRGALAALSADLVTLWLGGPSGDPAAWLRGFGWTPEVDDIRAVAESYGRPVPSAYDPAVEGAGRGWLIAARLTPGGS